ncbi:hypothetical protein OCU04_009295 [Sclerotinia nivalis]|uniref:Uncharacterized protein n=1 Tax=Sclerotinia nivalis TaxID=352851 RepID=A0A9X0AEV7_9HELO|nr:hypothetical protein OCU04_009295 [Sclerotinia nivalis]
MSYDDGDDDAMGIDKAGSRGLATQGSFYFRDRAWVCCLSVGKWMFPFLPRLVCCELDARAVKGEMP